MPRKSTGKPKHRPLIPIDWKAVDQMILSGLNGRQIAGLLDISDDTFYERFQIEKGSSFSGYRPLRKEGGDGMILMRQFKSAMNGNTQMLKLLGEERLGQGKKDMIGNEKMDIQLQAVMNQLKDLRENRASFAS